MALGVTELLTRQSGRVGVFRPVVSDNSPRATGSDPVISLLCERFGLRQRPEDGVGVGYRVVRDNPEAALAAIVERYHALAARCDTVLVVGSDYTDVSSPVEFEFNLRVAVNLATPVLLVVPAVDRDPDRIAAAVAVGRAQARAAHAALCGVVVNRADPAVVDTVRRSDPRLWVLPEDPSLTAPTMAEYAAACDATLLSGAERLLSRPVGGLLVAAMTLPNLLEHLEPDAVVITPGDRTELLLALLMAHQSARYPTGGGIVLTGGLRPPESVRALMAGLDSPLPVLSTEADTFDTATTLAAVRGGVTARSDTKIATALGLFAANVDTDVLRERLRLARSAAVTPLMFQHDLVERARQQRRRIVLPEGTEPRILRAADIVLRRGLAEVTLLGEPDEVAAVAARQGLDVSGARILSPLDPRLRDRFAREYAALRAHKGVSLDQAADIVTDVSYFGTLMVHTGLADGMVSGAAHTTAHTIRPSFEIIRTVPGTTIVSSVFFMCLAERVLVYGDCAVNPEPDAEQLADIAISSADTAAAFGVEPRVALLSYSTGDSGSGVDVDKVRAATKLVRNRRPELPVEGPIQYDAAVDRGVASAKLPDSAVAGRATVFVVPDLNTGNNLYKAVQRSANAVAVGPILQGLRKPVNDLSRGATVDDIVNTVAMTAIQSQEVAG